MTRPGFAAAVALSSSLILLMLCFPAPLQGAIPARTPAPAAAATTLRELKLPVRGRIFATSRQGTVAVLDPTADLVVMYPNLFRGSLEGGVQMRVGRMPMSMIHKQVGDKGYFLVACRGDGTVWALDDKTLQQVKTLRVSAIPAMVTAPSDPSVPYAYFTGGRTYDDRSVRRIDLRTMEETTQFKLSSDRYEVTFSADGRYIYARGPGSPSGFLSYRLAEPEGPAGAVVATPVVDQHRDSQTYRPDETGTYTAVGTTVFSADLKQELATLPAAPLLWMRQRPLAFGIIGPSLVAFSTNTFQQIGELRLPVSPQAKPAEKPYGPRAVPDDVPEVPGQPSFALPQRLEQAGYIMGYIPTVLADPQGQTLLACQYDRVVVVPLAAMKLPDEPFLSVDVEGPKRVTPEEAVQLKLTARDPRVKFELSSAPQGMRLENGQLLWTPTAEDMGVARATLRLFAGQTQRLQDVTIDVSRAAIGLPVMPHMIVMSPDRATMLVLGIVVVEPALRHLSDPQFKIATVDLKAQRVTGERTIKGDQFHQAADRWAIDDHFVYGCPASGDEIVVLSRKDLSEVKRLPTNGTPFRIVAIGNTRLMVSSRNGPVQSFSVPALVSLDPAGPPVPPTNAAVRDRQGEPPPMPVGDGWLYDGVLWDAQFDAPLFLYQPEARFSNVGGLRATRHDRMRGDLGISPWGVIASGPFLQRTNGEKIATIADQEGPNPTSMTLSSVPAAATLSRQNINDTPPHIRTEVALYELKAGQRAAAIVLEDRAVRNLPAMGQSQPPNTLREMAGGALVAQVEDRLFIISADQLKRATASFPTPLYFAPRQDVFVIDPGADTILKPVIVGGRGKVQLGPPPPPPGGGGDGMPQIQFKEKLVRTQSETGRIIISAGAFQRDISQLLQSDFFDNRTSSVDPVRAQQYRDRVATAFERIAGRVPQGIPVFAVIYATARDEDQQVATAEYCVLMDIDPGVPLPPLQPTLPPRGRGTATTAQTQQTTTQPAAIVESPAAPQDTSGVRRRNEELERRNKELEAELESLRRNAGRSKK